jgi:hypothetical protein
MTDFDPADFPPHDHGFHEVGPTTASEYLAQICELMWTAGVPSVTLATLQPSTGPPGVETDAVAWIPGLASYSWGIEGHPLADTAGQPIGFRIKVYTWLSDKVTNRYQVNTPTKWWQFTNQPITTFLTFTPSGSDVHLLNGDPAHPYWECDSFLFDRPTQQLLFHVPGVGIPLGIMIATFHPTGSLFGVGFD